MSYDHTLEEITQAVRDALDPLKVYDYQTDRQRAVNRDDIARLYAADQCISDIARALEHYKAALAKAKEQV